MNEGCFRRAACPTLAAAFFFWAVAGAAAEWKPGEGGISTRETREGSRLLKTELDRNSDGRPDAWTEFGKDGVRTKGAEDHDFDGFFERVFVYNARGGRIRDLADTNKDGKPDQFYLFPQGNRQTAMREYDRNFDGKIDSRNFAMWDDSRVSLIPDGQRVMRIPMPGYRAAWEERDDDFDGTIDFYRDYSDEKSTRVGRKIDPAPAEMPAAEPQAPAGVGGQDPVSTKARIDELNEKYGLNK